MSSTAVSKGSMGRRVWAFLVCMMLGWSVASAQKEQPDSVLMAVDSLFNEMMADTTAFRQLMADSLLVPIEGTDSLLESSEMPFVKEKSKGSMKVKRDWDTWRPDPQKAMWLALVIPGGGQIYNRKYWKLPIVYGGFIGCVYAMRWNNMMYKDYAQAYIDLMDDDPNTASYNQFLHLGQQITPANEERYKDIFRRRKDKYRRWRDLSFFVMVGVYAVSVIDAYVDAELSAFDISKDLSMKVRPTVIGNGSSANPLYATSLGVNCSINF